MKNKYQAILFASDGDFVTDCEGSSIEEVAEKINDLGSRWYFFPLRFIITTRHGSRVSPRQRIVEAPEELEFLKGKTVATVRKQIPDIAEQLYNMYIHSMDYEQLV